MSASFSAAGEQAAAELFCHLISGDLVRPVINLYVLQEKSLRVSWLEPLSGPRCAAVGLTGPALKHRWQRVRQSRDIVCTQHYLDFGTTGWIKYLLLSCTLAIDICCWRPAYGLCAVGSNISLHTAAITYILLHYIFSSSTLPDIYCNIGLAAPNKDVIITSNPIKPASPPPLGPPRYETALRVRIAN